MKQSMSATKPSSTAAQRAAPPAAMSIDVEDWFQVENLKAAIARDTWDERELRVERNTDRMLELMDEHNVKSTCFILGWVAERVPQLVDRIAAAGHEIASHGFGHELIYHQSRDEFAADIHRSKSFLEERTGQAVRGYRAPSFSITDWAIDVLREHGFTYDSSSFPTVAHDRYGRLSGMQPGQPIVDLHDEFTEVCVSCLTVGRRGLPWGGGGYFRLLPYPVFRRGVARILAAGRPYVFYIHPWEIDAGQPRVRGLRRSHRFRHYVNLEKCERRFAALLRDFSWVTMADLLDSWPDRAGNQRNAESAA
jgi:polysaccharide deacetylase family protein (PEP-CTERM system associated)